MTVRVAIVGSGPGAFYTAEALVKSGEAAEIDILERLPAPFGLIRYGVAPDHQSTKNVTRNFDRTARNEAVAYFGNVEVGRDVRIDELQEIYDAVVLAVGAPLDNLLGIPGEDKAGVVGSAAFVGWYNGHPDFVDLAPDFSTDAVCVIGNGNVAIDVARLFSKNREELRDSDISPLAQQAFAEAAVRDVYMFGRRGPVEAKFTNVELREMGQLADCVPIVDPAQLPEDIGEIEDGRERRVKARNLETLKEFVPLGAKQAAKRTHFAFYASPVEILGGERVEALRLERTEVHDGRAIGSGEYFEVACGLVIPAIGYRAHLLDGVPFDERRGIVVHDEGRIAERLYAVGWVKRGPTGVIATNRPDGKEVAAQIFTDCGAGADRPGRVELARRLGERNVQVVDYDQWTSIDAREIANARDGAPRRKFITVEDMLGALGESG